MDNQEELATQGAQKEEKQTKSRHNMCLTSLYANNINKACALLQTTGGKDAEIVTEIMELRT